MPTLSAVIITFNEALNIRACLESVSWADEIVVLDSGSTDGTVGICREFTDKVFYQEWQGYARQKNAAVDMAESGWVLSLDADERVTPELADDIRRVMSDPEALDGYYVVRQVFFNQRWLRHGGFYPERTLRLFRNGKGRFGDRAVHEAVDVDGRTGTLSGHLEHYTYNSVADFLHRMQRYTDLSAEEYLKQGRRTGPVRMTGHAVFTFIQMYVLKRGFLDGYPGFLMAVLYGVYTFVKYAKLYELAHK